MVRVITKGTRKRYMSFGAASFPEIGPKSLAVARVGGLVPGALRKVERDEPHVTPSTCMALFK